MAAALRWSFALCLLVGCDDNPSLTEQMQKQADAENKKKEDAETAKIEAAKKNAPEKKAEDPNALELPWTIDELRTGLEMGTTVDYAVTGVDAKGKKVEDTFFGVLKKNSEKEVGVTKYLGKMAKDPIASQVASLEWGSFSPFFPMEKPEHELVKVENVQVAAGSFNTVVVELKDFFGAHQTVWMIRDKPGIYAKVVDHGNTTNEGDKTEITYELTKIGKK